MGPGHTNANMWPVRVASGFGTRQENLFLIEAPILLITDIICFYQYNDHVLMYNY